MKNFNRRFLRIIYSLILIGSSCNGNNQQSATEKPKQFTTATDLTDQTTTDDGPGNNLFPHCGNGDIDTADGEECDGPNLGGKNCLTIDQGYATGELSCNNDCHFNTGNCFFAAEECTASGVYPTTSALQDGLPCNYDSECARGKCAIYKLDPDNAGIEARYCDGANHPSADPLPQIKDLPILTPCNFDRECASGYCHHGPDANICLEVCEDGTAGTAAYSCQHDPDALTGKSCLPNNRQGIDAPCTIGILDCADGLVCALGYCTKECSGPDDCTSGTCLPPSGSYPAICLSEMLHNTQLSGEKCLNDAHCQNADCEQGICQDPYQPFCSGPKKYPYEYQVPNGQPCNVPGDCISAQCNENGICGAADQRLLPTTDLPLYYPCATNNQCASGLCLTYRFDFSICALPCNEGATNNTYFICSNKLNDTWACIRTATDSGLEGDSCRVAAYDCSAKYAPICHEGRCITN